MIVIFKDADLEELLQTGKNKKYKDISKNKRLSAKLTRLYEIMTGADSIDDISVYSYLHYEKLKHNLSGISSVRPFGNQRVERLLFVEQDDTITIEILELDSTHYGNKK
ncbi:MAG: hypothetical protein J6M30_01170 [Bacteroidales bacterium]|nr:hypothetical protein [Bacteroidales bacterium]